MEYLDFVPPCCIFFFYQNSQRVNARSSCGSSRAYQSSQEFRRVRRPFFDLPWVNVAITVWNGASSLTFGMAQFEMPFRCSVLSSLVKSCTLLRQIKVVGYCLVTQTLMPLTRVHDLPHASSLLY